MLFFIHHNLVRLLWNSAVCFFLSPFRIRIGLVGKFLEPPPAKEMHSRDVMRLLFRVTFRQYGCRLWIGGYLFSESRVANMYEKLAAGVPACWMENEFTVEYGRNFLHYRAQKGRRKRRAIAKARALNEWLVQLWSVEQIGSLFVLIVSTSRFRATAGLSRGWFWPRLRLWMNEGGCQRTIR